LGNAFLFQGKLSEAIAKYQRALQLDPKDASTHGALSQALLAQGRFVEARNSARRCLQLLLPNDSSQGTLREILLMSERMLMLEKRLLAMILGWTQPKDANERLELATLCQRHSKSLYALSARFYADDFNALPKLAEDLSNQYRYSAACSSALAGCGQGKDAAKLGAKERTRLRQQALAWLRADLAAYDKLANGQPKERPLVQERLAYWKQDSNLINVRELAALASLPQAE